MYEMTEEQKNTLLYILNHLIVTGPDQGGLLNNAAGILRSLKSEQGAGNKPEKEDK